MTAIILTGLPAVAVILLVCATWCLPVLWFSLWLRDRAIAGLERRFRRQMAEHGCSEEEIDEAVREIEERR